MSMTPEDIKRKLDDFQRRTEVATKKKAALGGQLQAKREELAELIKEIKAAGYDPKNLSAERDKSQQDLEAAMTAYEKDLVEVETALTAFDKK